MDKKEKQTKQELIATTKAVKRKFRELHNEKLSYEEHLEEQYKPITKSLKTIIENQIPDEQLFKYNDNISSQNIKNAHSSNDKDDEQSDDSEYFETPNHLSKIKPRKINFDEDDSNEINDDADLNLNAETDNREIHWDIYNDVLLSRQNDTQFGVRRRGDALFIGKYKVKFNETTIKIRSQNFPITVGLLDLLFYKKPPTGYTKADLQQYKNILLLTNAHKKYFEKNQPIRKLVKGYKYKNIISPLFKSGSGIETDYMTVNSNKIDYTYWDDVNELVDRLRLLVSSSSVGHTGHNNEIISIIEELREANIIY